MKHISSLHKFTAEYFEHFEHFESDLVLENKTSQTFLLLLGEQLFGG